MGENLPSEHFISPEGFDDLYHISPEDRQRRVEGIRRARQALTGEDPDQAESVKETDADDQTAA